MSTHWDDLRGRIDGTLPRSGEKPTVKELLAANRDITRIMIEEINAAPCPHDGETNYNTAGGTYCGICQRPIPQPAVGVTV